jgi:hypothetical protein
MSPNKNTMNNSINLTELSTRESAMVEWKENVARIPDVIETIVVQRK